MMPYGDGIVSPGKPLHLLPIVSGELHILLGEEPPYEFLP